MISSEHPFRSFIPCSGKKLSKTSSLMGEHDMSVFSTGSFSVDVCEDEDFLNDL